MAIDRAKAEAVLNRARRTPAGLRYFYDQLKSPEWIAPLRSIGVFKTPAPVIREEGYISYPEWPESKFLARMAGQVPRLVRSIIAEIPATDNLSVHQDFIAAALAMPAELAAAIAALEAKWIENQQVLHGLYPETAGELISHLALGGQLGAALQLARALLAVVPDPRSTKGDYPFSSEPVARFDNWHYERILERDIVGKLLPSAPMDTLRLVADLLQTALEVHNRKYAETAEAKEDFSTIWRPRIEHERLKDFMQTLVTGVRDVATTLAAADEPHELEVAEELKKREWHVFRRLAIYVLAVTPHTPGDVFESIILERDNFERQGINPEFDLLLKNGFSRVHPDVRKRVLELIEMGPNQPRIVERWRQATGKELTKAEFERHADGWRLGWLTLLQEQLPPEQRGELEMLTAKYGQVDTDPTEGRGWVGPTSPVSSNELRRMTIEELVAYLQAFVPTKDWASPSPEGLSRTLSAATGEEPARFAQRANDFRLLHPTYIRGILDGLRSALKSSKAFEWVEVIRLSRWIVEQPRDDVAPLGEDADPDWGWTRKEVAALIGEGLSKNAIPVGNKVDILPIIQVLVEDPDPPPERDSGYLGSKHFPGMMALNTVRGVALDTAVQFALWLQLNGERPLDEVGPMLDRHLSLSNDPSYAVREVFGRVFPWLVKLDSSWASERVAEIFPRGNQDHRWIAWENYILFCSPYDAILPLLTQEYVWAVGQIGQGRGSEAGAVESHLAKHLMAFYWRGKIGFERGSILEDFFTRAPQALRQHALEFIGRSLAVEPDKPIPDEVLSRLRALWEARVAHASETATEKELAAFGWWFISGRFEEEWRCAQLIVALQLSNSIDAEWEVVKRLVPFVPKQPMFVLQALRMIVEADRQGWSIYGWQDEARQILSDSLSLARPEVFAAAKEVIDLLVAKGHIQYRALLKSPAH